MYGPTYVEWLGDLSCNLCFQDKFSASRAMHNLAQELPSPPPSSLQVNNKEKGNGDENEGQQTQGDDDYTPPDLGNMGWRLCNKHIRKVRILESFEVFACF